MGLYDSMLGERSSGSGGNLWFGGGPTFGSGPTAPSYSPPAPADTNTSKDQGPPQRFDVNKILTQTVQNTPKPARDEQWQWVQALAKAPSFFAGAPVALIQGVGKQLGFDPLGLVGDLPTIIPSLGTKADSQGRTGQVDVGPLHFQNVRGLVDSASDGYDALLKGRNALVNAPRAALIQAALNGKPDDKVYAGHLAENPLSLFGMSGSQQSVLSNAELLGMARHEWGFTDSDFTHLKDGGSIWDYANHDQLSANPIAQIAGSLATDPVNLAMIAMTGPVGVGIGVGMRAGEAALMGTRVGLGARAGIGMGAEIASKGLGVLKVPASVSANLIAKGGDLALQAASKNGVGEYLIGAARGPFGRDVGRGFAAGMKGMAYGVNPKGYVTGRLTLRSDARVWDRLTNVGSNAMRRGAVLRGEEFALGHGADFFTDHNNPQGSFSESLRDFGYNLLNEDPLSSSNIAVLATAFLTPIHELPGFVKGGVRRTMSAVTDKAILPGEVPADFRRMMVDLLAPEVKEESVSGARGTLHEAMKTVRSDYFDRWKVIEAGVGGRQGAIELYRHLTDNLTWEAVGKDTVHEIRIRSMPDLPARGQELRRFLDDHLAARVADGTITPRTMRDTLVDWNRDQGHLTDKGKLEGVQPKGKSAGPGMDFHAPAFMETWRVYRAAKSPFDDLMRKYGVTIGHTSALTVEVVDLYESALSKVATGTGKGKIVPNEHIQRMLQRYPQLKEYDPKFWLRFQLDETPAPKLSTVRGALTRLKKNADLPTRDQIYADISQNERATLGMGEEPLVSGSLALQDGNIRVASALPGESRAMVSRMRPELGATPHTYRETLALRDNPTVRAFEYNIGPVAHEAGLPVIQAHATVGGWLDADSGKVAMEPGMALNIHEDARVADYELTAALTGKAGNQDAIAVYITGADRLANAGVAVNGVVGRITGIPDALMSKVTKIIYQRYGKGFTLDDAAGEFTVLDTERTLPELQAHIDETVRLAKVGTGSVERGYIDFIGKDRYDGILAQHLNDSRITSFLDNANALEAGPASEALWNRVHGPNSVYLRPADPFGGSRARSFRHGATSKEGVIRTAMTGMEAEDGSVLPRYAEEHARASADLQELHRARSEMLSRQAYTVHGPQDPIAPLTVPTGAPVVDHADTLQKTWSRSSRLYTDQPPHFEVGTVRVKQVQDVPDVEAAVLREVNIDDLSPGQRAVNRAQVDAYMGDPPVEYPAATLVANDLEGNLMLTEGHHRVAAAKARGESSIKVWVKEERPVVDEASNSPYYLTLRELTDRDVSGWVRPVDRSPTTVRMDSLAPGEVPARVPVPPQPDPNLTVPSAELKDELVHFNLQRDVTARELYPMGGRWDASTGTIDPAARAELEHLWRYMQDHLPQFDLVHAPEINFPSSQMIPAAIKTHTLIGEMLYEYGPAAKVTRLLENLFSPVNSVRQSRLARMSIYKLVAPFGGTQEHVDKWMGEMNKTIKDWTSGGKYEHRLFKDAGSLPPTVINAAAERAFPPEVIAALGGKSNFNRLLQRASNRFVRDTLHPSLTGGGKRGLLQRATARGYTIWQTGRISGALDAGVADLNPLGKAISRTADLKQLTAKVAYPIFRFMADPRWHIMNYPEPIILSSLRDGIASQETLGLGGASTAGVARGAGGARQMAQSRNRLLQDATDPLLEADAGAYGAGLTRNRALAGFVDKVMQRRGVMDTKEIIDRSPEWDPYLRDLMKLFPDSDSRSIYEKVNDMIYHFDELGPKRHIMDEAKRMFGLQKAAEMEPLLSQIIIKHESTYKDVVNMLMGNSDRSNMERIANSWWLFWPLSYQLKTGKWLWEVMGKSALGKKSNAGGAALWNRAVEQHQERIVKDPAYRQFFQDHESAFFLATSILPLTPGDLGVSLNRGIRGIGGQLGLWGQYARAKDPASFVAWMAELGPYYTFNMLQQIWTETFSPHRGRKGIESPDRGGGTSARGGIDTSGISPTSGGINPPTQP